MEPHGEGPADAFFVIPTYSVPEATKAARSQRALMGTTTPPSAIARAWTAWRSYLDLVIKTIAKHPTTDSALGPGGALAEALNGPTQKVDPQRAKLEKYAFKHCK